MIKFKVQQGNKMNKGDVVCGVIVGVIGILILVLVYFFLEIFGYL